jgi:capsular exopolysaccharide synthesis family protein
MHSLAIKRSMITDQLPLSATSDKYRALRNKIDHFSQNKPTQVILITSTLPLEGKTTTAINLAIAYAQAEKKVLLIDGNLYQPTIHNIFSLPNHVGLTSILSGQCQFGKAVRDSMIQNVSILTSGPFPVNNSDPLATKQTTLLLDEAKLRYDVILVDSPALLAVSDTSKWATQTDGTLLVIRSGFLKQDKIKQGKQLLDHMQVNLIGSVLNHTKSNRNESYYHYSALRKKND